MLGLLGAKKLMGGGAQTTSVAPWKPAQPYIKEGFAQAQDLLNRPTFNPLQQQGMDMATQYADSLGGMTGNAQNAWSFLTSPSLLSPDSNPYLAQMAQAAARPVMQNLTENILPALGSSAEMAGQYGGSRQGIAEGIAMRGANQTIADQTANLYGNAYQQGLNTMMQGLGQAGNVANLGLMPSNIYQQVGTTQQQQPWQDLQNYMGVVGGNFGSTQSTPTASPLPALIGGGLGFALGGPAGASLGMSAGSLLG